MSMQGESYEGDYEPEQDVAPNGGRSMAMVKTDVMGGMEVARRNELAASTAQARVTAMVQAKYALAMRNPRDTAVVREALLRRCEQIDFAEVAIYRRPQGKKKNEQTGKWEDNFIEGLSIRFVEEAIRANRNMGIDTAVLYDDDEKQIVRCSVMDYEDITEASAEITIYKTVERRDLKKGQRPISTRLNSYGDNVYILPATDDEVRMKVARAVSMQIRTLGLRMLPGGVVAEAKRRVYDTLRKQDAGKDPLTVRREVADKFAALGISAAAIAEYFGGTSVEQITNDQLLELRVIGATINSGEATWREILDGSPYREPTGEVDEKGAEKTSDAASLVAKKVKDALAKKRAPQNGGDGQPQAAPAAPPPPSEPKAPGAATPPAQAPAQPPAAASGAAAKAARKATPAQAPASAPAPNSAEGIAAATGLPVATVQAVLKAGKEAPDTATDDTIAMSLVDRGIEVTGTQVGDIFARANG